MSDGFSYIISMVDQISGPAKTAEQRIQAMTSKLTSQSAALDEMKKEYEALAPVFAEDNALRQKAVAMLAKQEAAVEKTTEAIRKSVAQEQAAAAKQAATAEKAAARELQGIEKKLAAETKQNIAAAKTHADLQAKAAVDAKNAQAKAADEAKKAMADRIATAERVINVGKDTIVSGFNAIASSAKALAAGDVKGAVDGLVGGVANLAKLLDLAVPGLGQAVSMVVTITGGFAGVLVGLTQAGAAFALEATEAKTRMLAMFDAMGGGAVTGAQTEEMIDNLKAKTGVLKDELVDYTKQLMAMGETDLGRLESGVTAMASASALMGKEGVAAFTGLKAKIEEATTAGQGLKLADKQLAKLYATGVNVDDIAKAMGTDAKKLRDQLTSGTVDAAKFGDALEAALIEKGKGPLDTMTSGLPYLKKMFLESVGDMFEDVKVGPFLSQVKALFGIFGQANPVGQTLKAGIGGFFDLVFKTLAEIVPKVRVFFTQLMIYAVQAYIAVKPLVTAVRDFGGAGKEGPGTLSVIMKTVLEAIEGVGAALKPTITKLAAFVKSATGAKLISTVLGALWTVLKSVAVAVVAIVAVFAAMWTAGAVIAVTIWTIIGSLIGFAATLTQDVAGAITGILTFFASVGGAIAEWVGGAASAAADFVAGLVNGIGNGVSAVVDAVSGLAGKATGAFKSALGIASPSKVMMGLGLNTTQGLAGGIDQGTGEAVAAMQDTAGAVAGAAAVAPATPAATTGGGSGAPTISVNVTINAGAAASPEALLELLTSQLADKLEEIWIQLGGGKVGSTG